MRYAFLHVQSGLVGGSANLPQMIQQAVSLLAQKARGRLVTSVPIIQGGETRGVILIAEVPDGGASGETQTPAAEATATP